MRDCMRVRYMEHAFSNTQIQYLLEQYNSTHVHLIRYDLCECVCVCVSECGCGAGGGGGGQEPPK